MPTEPTYTTPQPSDPIDNAFDHPFSVTCTCHSCERTWTAYDEAERAHEASDARF